MSDRMTPDEADEALRTLLELEQIRLLDSSEWADRADRLQIQVTAGMTRMEKILALRARREAVERLVIWRLTWQHDVQFGLGLTRHEAEERCSRHMRSGWWRGGSDAYHHITLEPVAWRNPWPE